MHVYPSPGLLVRDPVMRDFLPPEGREVPDGDFYWLRRISCGDATLALSASAADLVSDEIAAAPSTPLDGSDEQ